VEWRELGTGPMQAAVEAILGRSSAIPERGFRQAVRREMRFPAEYEGCQSSIGI